jgi:hypothetical protein
MKQAIALTSACALFLMPIHRLAAQSASPPTSAAPTPLTSSPALVPKIPSNPTEMSPEGPTATLQGAKGEVAPPPSDGRVQKDELSAAAKNISAAGNESAKPAAEVITQMKPPEGAVLITPQLPLDVAESLKEQQLGRSPKKAVPSADGYEFTRQEEQIASHGDQAVADGPEQCPKAAPCGARQSLGFTMMAWGAALAGIIGLIVWIGKAGDDCCCGSGSTSSCSTSCCCN